VRKSVIIFSVFVLAGCGTMNKKPSTQSVDVLPPPKSESDIAAAKAQEAIVEDAEIKEIEKIQEIQSQTKDDLDTMDSENKIPVEINALVNKWIAFFQGRGRSLMDKYLSRSARYMPMMKKILSDRGLPEDLVYIALIESGFSPVARSHAGAVGYWQFMPGTGRDYGLKINSVIDERRDPVLATQAAADYFSGLYNLFGSWYLAMASYNVGENRVKRLVMQNQSRDFWDLAKSGKLPAETVNYVPKFIAAKLIAKNPAKYGFHDVDYKNPYAFDEVKVEGTISLRKMARALRIDEAEIKYLNPMFRTDYALPARGNSFRLRVPEGTEQQAAVALADAKVSNLRAVAQTARLEDRSVVRYKVKRGDSLTQVAARFGISIGTIAKVNKLTPRSNLRVGQTLVIVKDAANLQVSVRKEMKTSDKVHVVRRGDTLAGISRKYRVPIREIASANGMRSKSRLLAGDRLKIPN
jgi:membrane-bound lytic murein transglycosylase D